jgi:hypothetical protein
MQKQPKKRKYARRQPDWYDKKAAKIAHFVQQFPQLVTVESIIKLLREKEL